MSNDEHQTTRDYGCVWGLPLPEDIIAHAEKQSGEGGHDDESDSDAMEMARRALADIALLYAWSPGGRLTDALLRALCAMKEAVELADEMDTDEDDETQPDEDSPVQRLITFVRGLEARAGLRADGEGRPAGLAPQEELRALRVALWMRFEMLKMCPPGPEGVYDAKHRWEAHKREVGTDDIDGADEEEAVRLVDALARQLGRATALPSRLLLGLQRRRIGRCLQADAGKLPSYLEALKALDANPSDALTRELAIHALWAEAQKSARGMREGAQAAAVRDNRRVLEGIEAARRELETCEPSAARGVQEELRLLEQIAEQRGLVVEEGGADAAG